MKETLTERDMILIELLKKDAQYTEGRADELVRQATILYKQADEYISKARKIEKGECDNELHSTGIPTL